MTIETILNDIYPEDENIKSSIVEREFWLYKRQRLRKMIEMYKAREIINFEPLKIGVDFNELMKRINN